MQATPLTHDAARGELSLLSTASPIRYIGTPILYIGTPILYIGAGRHGGAHTIAAHFRDTLEDRRALRGYVVDEVKRTNGQIKFEDAQDVQRQLPDDTWRD